MGERKLYLAYSSTPSAKVQEAAWASENAQQLPLFDDFGKIRIVMVYTDDVNFYSFRDVLCENNPQLIVDTRYYPEFFNIFPSLDAALKVFKTQGREYKHVPLATKPTDKEVWTFFDELKRVFSEYLESHTGAPVLLLTSTRWCAAHLVTRVPGYLSQEVAETVLEQFP